MATDLRCPRCQGPVSTESAQCPQCSSVSRRRTSRISEARPFKAPPGWVVPSSLTAPPPTETECPTRSRSWLAAPIAALLALIVLFAGWCWISIAAPRADESRRGRARTADAQGPNPPTSMRRSRSWSRPNRRRRDRLKPVRKIGRSRRMRLPSVPTRSAPILTRRAGRQGRRGDRRGPLVP